jgi:hypothetical protein
VTAHRYAFGVIASEGKAEYELTSDEVASWCAGKVLPDGELKLSIRKTGKPAGTDLSSDEKGKIMMISTASQTQNNRKTAGAWSRLLICGAALAMSLGLTTSASAWSYTIEAPITIDASNNDGSGVLGTINVVSGHFLIPTPTGNAVGSVLDNATDKTLQDFVWFSITLDAGSAAIDRIQAAIAPVDFFNPELYDFTGVNNNPVGASYSTLSGGVGPNGNGFASAVAIDSGFGAFSQYNWDFGAVSANNLQAGSTSADLLWVGELLQSGGQGVIYNNVINFMIQTAGGGVAFDVAGVVPEPSTGLLLAGGLCGISMMRRREQITAAKKSA